MTHLKLDDIVAVLDRQRDLSAWQVTETRSRSTQRYTVFTRDEARREVETTRYNVTVHVRHPHDGAERLGESSFTLTPHVTTDWLRQEIDGAIQRAALVHNEVYEIPAPDGKGFDVVTVDQRVVENAAAIVDEVTEDIRAAAAAHAGVELSSSEVFANYAQTRLRNSKGLDVSRAETELMVEYVLLAKDGKNEEHEIWQSPKSRLLSHLQIKDHVDRYVQYTRDGLDAQLPRSGTFDVVFGEEALDTLWSYFSGQADAAARYEGWSRLKLGSPVINNPRGDRITLISDPTLEGGMASEPFDGMGQRCLRTTIIEDNIFKQYIATRKYADLTGVPATGPMGNTVVLPGKTPEKDLFKGKNPVYELLRFSTFMPSPTSGSFSGEIRTGYLHKGGKRIPIKGGSVSGNVQQAFQNATFSSEITRREAYHGPRAVLLTGLTLSGE
ncbi:MAG: metallopeptidase TldD-related protein [Myxococcota bacterium]